MNNIADDTFKNPVGFDLRKVDRRVLIEALKQEILNLLQNNKGKYFTLEQMTEHAKRNFHWLWDLRAVGWLAWEHGVKGLISTSIHAWRGQGHIIVSSAEKGKGYVYIDPNDSNSPEYWDSKFLANESQRQQIPQSERDLDIELFRATYRNCENASLKQELEKVAIRRGIPREKL